MVLVPVSFVCLALAAVSTVASPIPISPSRSAAHVSQSSAKKPATIPLPAKFAMKAAKAKGVRKSKSKPAAEHSSSPPVTSKHVPGEHHRDSREGSGHKSHKKPKKGKKVKHRPHSPSSRGVDDGSEADHDHDLASRSASHVVSRSPGHDHDHDHDHDHNGHRDHDHDHDHDGDHHDHDHDHDHHRRDLVDVDVGSSYRQVSQNPIPSEVSGTRPNVIALNHHPAASPVAATSDSTTYDSVLDATPNLKREASTDDNLFGLDALLGLADPQHSHVARGEHKHVHDHDNHDDHDHVHKHHHRENTKVETITSKDRFVARGDHIHEHMHGGHEHDHGNEHVHKHVHRAKTESQVTGVRPLFQAKVGSLKLAGLEHYKSHKRAVAPDATVDCSNLDKAVPGYLQLVSPTADDNPPQPLANLVLSSEPSQQTSFIMNASNNSHAEIMMVAQGEPDENLGGTIPTKFMVKKFDQAMAAMSCLCTSFNPDALSPLILLPCNADTQSANVSQIFAYDPTTSYVAPLWKKNNDSATSSPHSDTSKRAVPTGKIYNTVSKTVFSGPVEEDTVDSATSMPTLPPISVDFSADPTKKDVVLAFLPAPETIVPTYVQRVVDKVPGASATNIAYVAVTSAGNAGDEYGVHTTKKEPKEPERYSCEEDDKDCVDDPNILTTPPEEPRQNSTATSDSPSTTSDSPSTTSDSPSTTKDSPSTTSPSPSTKESASAASPSSSTTSDDTPESSNDDTPESSNDYSPPTTTCDNAADDDKDGCENDPNIMTTPPEEKKDGPPGSNSASTSHAPTSESSDEEREKPPTAEDIKNYKPPSDKVAAGAGVSFANPVPYRFMFIRTDEENAASVPFMPLPQ